MWTPANPDLHRRFPSTWLGSAAFRKKLLKWFFLAVVTLIVSVQAGSGPSGNCH